jgi:acyl-CoA thioesterase
MVEHPRAAAAKDAHAIAEAVRQRMLRDDAATQALGMHVEAIGPGYARVSMTVRPDMLNGFRICHGGLLTTLADSAFAYGCNSYNEMTVASGIVVDFLASAHDGDRLVAECHEVSRTGRTGVYDIKVINQHGKAVMVMRGRSHTIKGRPVAEL